MEKQIAFSFAWIKSTVVLSGTLALFASAEGPPTVTKNGDKVTIDLPLNQNSTWYDVDFFLDAPQAYSTMVDYSTQEVFIHSIGIFEGGSIAARFRQKQEYPVRVSYESRFPHFM